MSHIEHTPKLDSALKLQTMPPPPKADFPTYHTLKLCILGKAFSGKNTQAQLLVQKLGADKVTLFNMSEIIREALQYVDPSQAKEEVVDPKAKGKAKPPADAPSDVFSGQDTTKYKEVANLILQQIQLTTGNKESLPGKDVDIVDLVTDDSMLI
mmetsp:Transcript_21955/g.34105  ORF Transcript_21955/g.34105 Transcript_21955/m.34105 type:complete len:154 (+) Transcript_21955:1947-2408(+)